MSQLQLGHMLVMIAFSVECRHGREYYHEHGISCALAKGDLGAQLINCISGRADYFGLAVNRAARFLGAACGGQVLAERGLVEEVVQYWHSLVYK